MNPLKVERIYLNDAVYKRLRLYRRGSEYPVPYILSVCFDTFDTITKEHEKYISEHKIPVVDIITYTTLFGDLSTTIRVNIGPIVRTTPLDDFAFLKENVKNESCILLNLHNEDYLVREWSRMFVHLFEWSEE